MDMKNRRNIGVNILIILTITSVMIFFAVRISLDRYIKNEAIRSVQNCEGFLRKRDADSFMEYSEGKNLFHSYYFLVESPELSYTAESEYGVENLVRNWCEDNSTKINKIYTEELGDRVFYIKQIKLRDTNDRIAIYTDVSSAIRMSNIVILILIIVMVISDIVSTALGFRM